MTNLTNEIKHTNLKNLENELKTLKANISNTLNKSDIKLNNLETLYVEMYDCNEFKINGLRYINLKIDKDDLKVEDIENIKNEFNNFSYNVSNIYIYNNSSKQLIYSLVLNEDIKENLKYKNDEEYGELRVNLSLKNNKFKIKDIKIIGNYKTIEEIEKENKKKKDTLTLINDYEMYYKDELKNYMKNVKKYLISEIEKQNKLYTINFEKAIYMDTEFLEIVIDIYDYEYNNEIINNVIKFKDNNEDKINDIFTLLNEGVTIEINYHNPYNDCETSYINNHVMLHAQEQKIFNNRFIFDKIDLNNGGIVKYEIKKYEKFRDNYYKIIFYNKNNEIITQLNQLNKNMSEKDLNKIAKITTNYITTILNLYKNA